MGISRFNHKNRSATLQRCKNSIRVFGILSFLLFFQVAVPSLPAQKFKLNGEYGLWVQEANGQLEVHWITSAADSGFLTVYNDGERHYHFTTPSAQAHRVAFARNPRAALTLRYGSLMDTPDQHETTIYPDPQRPTATFSNVDSIFVLGDIHGQFDNVVQLLTAAKLIDAQLNWIGSKQHLVVLGDMFDRGHDVTRVLWFLYKLEKSIEQRGGKLHIVLGNHEIMTFCNDLRYLSGKENLIAATHGAGYSEMYHPRRSIIGKWLATKPGLLKIDEVLFAHGGVTPAFANYSIQSFNDSLSAFLNEESLRYLLDDSLSVVKMDSVRHARRLLFFFADNSVFWYRGYVTTDTLQGDLQYVLKKFKSELQVVGHTPVPTITPFYAGNVIAANVVNFVSEMLLLVRSGKKKYQRYRYKMTGEVEPLEIQQ